MVATRTRRLSRESERGPVEMDRERRIGEDLYFSLYSLSMSVRCGSPNPILHGPRDSFTTKLTTVVKDAASGRRCARGANRASVAVRSGSCQTWRSARFEERAQLGLLPFFAPQNTPKNSPNVPFNSTLGTWQLARHAQKGSGWPTFSSRARSSSFTARATSSIARPTDLKSVMCSGSARPVSPAGNDVGQLVHQGPVGDARLERLDEIARLAPAGLDGVADDDVGPADRFDVDLRLG